jgi:pyruvate/2-oxoglutarate dehydrogenase complex dihydrolipoamide dehydrogenase (E3) component
MVIVGAGATGLELGQAFRRLGADVTLIELAKPLADVDPEFSAPVLRQVEASTGFRIDAHRLELFGRCPACR